MFASEAAIGVEPSAFAGIVFTGTVVADQAPFGLSM